MAITDREKIIREAAKPFVDRLSEIDNELAKLEEDFVAKWQPLMSDRAIAAEDVTRISAAPAPRRESMLKVLNLDGAPARRARARRSAESGGVRSSDARQTEVKNYLASHPGATIADLTAALDVSQGTIKNAINALGSAVVAKDGTKPEGARGRAPKVYTLA